MTISLKIVNVKGGGYSNFLDQLRKDGTTNCLAKFIIIDGDRAVNETGEQENLRELLDYCILQNKSGRTPHLLIVSYPDFEYIACLHTPKFKNQNVTQYIIKEMGYKTLASFKSDSKIYQKLNSNGNSCSLMLSSLKEKDCLIVNNPKVNRNLYEIKACTKYDFKNLSKRGSNINEFFEVINCFYP